MVPLIAVDIVCGTLPDVRQFDSRISMKIRSISAKNYRSLVDFEMTFENHYTVISGKNNAGKSAIFSAIEVLVGFNRNEAISFGPEKDEVTWSEDITFWKRETKEDISISCVLEINEVKDASLFEFVKRISREEISNDVSLKIRKIVTYEQQINIDIYLNESPSPLDPIATQEIRRLLRERGVFILHDSTNQVRVSILRPKWS